MSETIKQIIKANLGAFIIAFCSVVFFVFGYILSIRSDLNATQLQVQALQQSIQPIQSLITEVAAIKQASVDTNEKVNALYSHFIK